MPDQLLAAKANTIAYQMEEYKNSGLVVILHCLNSFQHKNYIVLLRENHNVNAACFPSFYNGYNLARKVWRRLRMGELKTSAATWFNTKALWIKEIIFYSVFKTVMTLGNLLEYWVCKTINLEQKQDGNDLSLAANSLQRALCSNCPTNV